MSLIEPVIGGTLSPTWAQDLNANMGTLDSHNHQPGSGIPITPAGLNISSDLSFLINNATNLRATRYSPITLGSLTGTDLNEIIVSGVDLYYVDGLGNQIRMTQSGGLAGTSGSISGLTSPASASYVSASSTFVWQSNSGVAANMDAATYILRYPSTGYPSPSGNYIALEAPSSLATGYSFVFPASLPVSTSLMQLSSAGQVSASNTIANPVTIGASGAVLSNSGTTLMVSNILVVGSGVYPSGGGNASFQGRTSNSIDIQNAGATTSHPIVVSANPSSSGLMIVRGGVSSGGSITTGEGFSVTGHSTGQYTISFTTAFQDAPVVVGSMTSLGGFIIANGPGTTGFVMQTTNNAGSLADRDFNFVAIGQRNN